MSKLTQAEEDIWNVAFATAWANTELLGELKRRFEGGDGTIHRRRPQCERIADDCVNAFRAGRGRMQTTRVRSVISG